MERRSSYRALVVEDDGAILSLLKALLERQEFTVEGVTNGASAIELLSTVAYDLVLIDLMLPEVAGEEVLEWIERTKPHYLRRVIVTTASPGRIQGEFLESICRVLSKPFDIEKLMLYARECSEPDVAA
jgi:DNA-binding response OmpR family regulator